jgi:hypothetical protein
MSVGMIVGGMILVYLFSVLFEWAIFKRVADTAKVGITLSVIAGVILTMMLFGFIANDDGHWNPFPQGIAYVVSGAIIWVLRMMSYRRKAEEVDPGVQSSCCSLSATSFMKRASSPLASHSASAAMAPSMSARRSVSALA